MVFDWIKKKAFIEGLRSTETYRRFVRPAAYAIAGGDPELVHEMALDALNKYEDAADKYANEFYFPELKVKLAGHTVMPFGTAAGLDKNGEALNLLSKIFGFLEPGTVVVNPREGNKRPRIAVDEKNHEIYNAQGFPSKGLDYFLDNIKKFREHSKTPLLVSVCGIPPSSNQLDVASKELETLVEKINPYADGFVWNPFSPNTAALAVLRNPEEFKRNAELIKRKAEDKIRLVKMGPYDDIQRTSWFDLVRAWMHGGGQGIVAINTFMVPKGSVPSEDWGYPTAGRSGRFLQTYRQRAVNDMREEFEDYIEGYTPYTFKGFGLVKEIGKGIQKELKRTGTATLEEFIEECKDRINT